MNPAAYQITQGIRVVFTSGIPRCLLVGRLISCLRCQLPLEPPVLMGFFPPPIGLAALGLAMNLEPCGPPLGPLLPALPPFLLFTGNAINV